MSGEGSKPICQPPPTVQVLKSYSAYYGFKCDFALAFMLILVLSNMQLNRAADDLGLCSINNDVSGLSCCRLEGGVRRKSGVMGVVLGFTRCPKWAQSQLCDAGLSLSFRSTLLVSVGYLLTLTVIKFNVKLEQTTVFWKTSFWFFFLWVYSIV